MQFYPTCRGNFDEWSYANTIVKSIFINKTVLCKVLDESIYRDHMGHNPLERANKLTTAIKDTYHKKKWKSNGDQVCVWFDWSHFPDVLPWRAFA